MMLLKYDEAPNKQIPPFVVVLVSHSFSMSSQNHTSPFSLHVVFIWCVVRHQFTLTSSIHLNHSFALRLLRRFLWDLFIPLNASEVTCESDTKDNVNCMIYILFSDMFESVYVTFFSLTRFDSFSLTKLCCLVFFSLRICLALQKLEPNVCACVPIRIADVFCFSCYFCALFSFCSPIWNCFAFAWPDDAMLLLYSDISED